MRARVITVSDSVSAGEAEDRSGPRAVEMLVPHGFVVSLQVVPDGVASVQEAIRRAAEQGMRLVVTTGGTGFGPRDLTPEATKPLLDREAPGLSEAMRAATFGVNPHGMLSRGVSGIIGTTVVVNLPEPGVSHYFFAVGTLESGTFDLIELVIPGL